MYTIKNIFRTIIFFCIHICTIIYKHLYIGILDFNNPNYSPLATNSSNLKNNHWQSQLLTYWNY
ncbi:hypothetical protein Hanom_Chr02g00138401 [Helianthus anomalus]